jgi:hypothetical protein
MTRPTRDRSEGRYRSPTGTMSSNPVSSSGESRANLTYFWREVVKFEVKPEHRSQFIELMRGHARSSTTGAFNSM